MDIPAPEGDSKAMTAKKSLTLKIFLFLVLTDMLETLAQFCFKKSAISSSFPEIDTLAKGFLFLKTVIVSPFLWLALFLVVSIFVIWSTLLSKIDLSVAVPVASFSYITVPLVSAIFLHEQISLLRWSGIALIIAGVILVSVSSVHNEGAL